MMSDLTDKGADVCDTKATPPKFGAPKKNHAPEDEDWCARGPGGPEFAHEIRMSC